jgi:hypothetical protein
MVLRKSDNTTENMSKFKLGIIDVSKHASG